MVVRVGTRSPRMVGSIFPKLSSQSTVMVGKQVTLLNGSLGVEEVLIVGKRQRGVQNVNAPGHVHVDQADHPIVTRLRECHRVDRSGSRDATAVYARGTVEVIRCSAWATDHDSRTHLPWREKSHAMTFRCRENPSDAVSGVNPDFVGQKRQRLHSFVCALRSDSRLPGLGVNCLRKNDRGTEQHQPRQFSSHIDLLFLFGVAGRVQFPVAGNSPIASSFASRKDCYPPGALVARNFQVPTNASAAKHTATPTKHNAKVNTVALAFISPLNRKAHG